jgi:hypothetical protein
MAAGFALAAYILVTFKPATLWNAHAWWQSIAVWLAAAIIFHDLALFPLYALADRLLGIATKRRRRRPRGHLRVPARNYIRIPALGSGLSLATQDRPAPAHHGTQSEDETSASPQSLSN